MSCKLGGFVGLRHNEVRDLTAKLLTEVYKDVTREPKLVNKSNDHDEDLRADISARGVWQPLQRAFFDVKVFHPLAQSYRNQSLEATFRSMENQKKRKYNTKIQDKEYGSFTPLIFSTNGGMSRETSIFISKLSEKIAEKRDTRKSDVISWIRRKYMFSIIRCAIICIRGTRSRRNYIPDSITENISIAHADGKIVENYTT